jgi:Helix-turn-helix domain
VGVSTHPCGKILTMEAIVKFTLPDDEVERIAEAVATRVDQGREWFTVAEAAKYTSLSPGAIRHAAKGGRLVSHKGSSGRLAFRAQDLDCFMSG